VGRGRVRRGVVGLRERALGEGDALERVAQELSENPVVLPGGEEILLTLSGGACGSTTAGETVQKVFARANRALYRAKEEGKNRFVYV
jgi:two-component system, cell cycle response regulator